MRMAASPYGRRETALFRQFGASVAVDFHAQTDFHGFGLFPGFHRRRPSAGV
jgi:hypothetical protein